MRASALRRVRSLLKPCAGTTDFLGSLFRQYKEPQSRRQCARNRSRADNPSWWCPYKPHPRGRIQVTRSLAVAPFVQEALGKLVELPHQGEQLIWIAVHNAI